VCATGLVFAGTLYPILFDVMHWGKISVGPPYFNTVFVPIALVTLFFTGIGPLINWKRHQMALLKRTMLQALVISVILAAVALWVYGRGWSWLVFLSLSLCVWVAWITLSEAYKKVRTAKAGFVAGVGRLSLSYKGMVLAHVGLVIAVAGVALTSHYTEGRDVRMHTGDEVKVGPYDFRFEGVRQVQGPNYESTEGTILASVDGKHVATLQPEKRRYYVRGNVMTEAAIDPGFARDLYVALGESMDDGSWAVRLYYKPFMRWVWGGGALMALGGFIALSDRRYRLHVMSRAARLGRGLVGGNA